MTAHIVTRRRIIAAGVAGLTVPLFGSARAASQRSLQVKTREGIIVGEQGDGYVAWRGVPFAKPPVNELRGRAPQRLTPRRSSLDTKAYRSMAVQLGVGPTAGKLIGSEDCLYLNVWAPSAATTQLPVIVWIHGGGFIVGSASEPQFAGDYYAAHANVVFVTINYRLGGFGYLHNPNEPGSANLGTLDQIAALEWVRNNIAAFGGDAGNITVMGESAGAMSIGHLLGTPLATGKFDRAIIQSGATSHFFSNQEPTEIAERVFHAANVPANNYAKLLSMEVDQLNNAFSHVFETGGDALVGPIPFHSSLDGVVFKQHPLRSLNPVPTVISHCKTEMLFFAMMRGSPVFDGVTNKQQALLDAATWQTIRSQYQTALHNQVDPDLELRSDAFCAVASLRLADELKKKGAPVWSYRFDYDKASPFGAGHASDVPFSLYRGGAAQGPNAPAMSAEAQSIATALWSSHVAFARSGNPSVPALPSWPQHQEVSIPFMSIDVKPTVKYDFIGEQRRRAWSVVPPEKMV